jgi:hypothetical protein
VDEADTRQQLIDALRAHVAASADGAYLTDFIIIAAAAMPNDPDATTYVTETSDGLAAMDKAEQRVNQLLDRRLDATR